MEFFSPEVREPDEDLLKMFAGIGSQIGQFVQRKQAEEALRRSKELLETLVERRTRALRVANIELKNEIDRRKGLEGEILKVTDREQQRLGRELHDGLCQQLTGIGFMAQTAALRLEKHRVVDGEELKKIAKLVRDSALEARMIARDLHKEQIEAAGFERALRTLTERQIWSTPCQLLLQTKIEIDNDKAASEIYRIVREAIINANKHARAKRIIISARRHKRDLAISVEDDGVGLNGEGVTSDGLGFRIMKYRAEMIGARVNVESPRKGGTRVTVYLPDRAHSSDPSY
jgi:signal transduction histidine kinase